MSKPAFRAFQEDAAQQLFDKPLDSLTAEEFGQADDLAYQEWQTWTDGQG